MARIYTAWVHNTDLPSMTWYIQPEYTILTYLPWPDIYSLSTQYWLTFHDQNIYSLSTQYWHTFHGQIYTAWVHNTDLPSMTWYIQPEYTILTYLPWPEYIQPEYTILTYLPWPEYIQPEYTILTFATSRYKPLKSTCYVNLLSKLSIIFLRNEELLFSLSFRYYTQTFFCYKINKL
jgi:hypothetical protein